MVIVVHDGGILKNDVKFGAHGLPCPKSALHLQRD